MRAFEYHAPTQLDEAVEILHQHGTAARALAGGTDLVVQMKEGVTRFPFPSHLISLKLVSQLQGIDFGEVDGLRIGAAVTMAEVSGSPLVRQRFLAIAEGAGVVGSFQTMNIATVGGNLCNAAPSADIAPPLLVYEAEAVIVGPQGRRSLPLDEFFLGPGRTALMPGELLVEVRVPTPSARSAGAYVRHTPRKQMDIAVVGVGVVLTLGDGGTIEKARVALGAVAPTPVRSQAAESVLEGRTISEELFARAAEAAASESKPISDTRGSVDFRSHLVQVLTERMIRTAIARATNG